MAASKTRQAVDKFMTVCRDSGFVWDVSDYSSVVSISSVIPQDDLDAYVRTENTAFRIFDYVPQTAAGSVWGSTSDGVGGHVAVTTGNFELHKSGISKRFLNELRKRVYWK